MSSWKPDTIKAYEIVEKIKSKEITVPQYQRGQVWKSEQEEKLIDSIKNNFPFGTILLYKKGDKEYHLIDGLQRCTTLLRYLENPAKFFNINIDIDNSVVEKIYDYTGYNNSHEQIKQNIRLSIFDWVKNNHNNLSDIENMRPNLCARELKLKYPTITNDSEILIDDLLSEMFLNYKKKCKIINDTQIPLIIYEGNESHLPEVFNRINSKGTILSKYQILAATWTTSEFKLIEPELFDVINFVEKFFYSIQEVGYGLSNYNQFEFKKQKKVNLFQLVFGFGKLITHKYPHLFPSSNNNSEAESCGFNLINACLANKNSKLKDLPSLIKSEFKDDAEVNKFLINILRSIDEVDKVLSPYILFKMNSRNKKVNIYHTEMQVCSVISNVFINRYVQLYFNEKDELYTRKILTESSKKDWESYKSKFKKYCFLNYLNDVLLNSWKGSGDNLLDEVSLNSDYYTKERNRIEIGDIIENWYKQRKTSRLEFKNPKDPDAQDKILLSIIYSNKFTATDQLDTSKYDIEHLCPKNQMIEKLKKFQNISVGKLPISSFANICLLPEWDNRKKKDKTIYQDTNYLKQIGSKLDIIQKKFTFTSEDMMKWILKDHLTFDELKDDYYNFLDTRFHTQKQEILDILFNKK